MTRTPRNIIKYVLRKLLPLTLIVLVAAGCAPASTVESEDTLYDEDASIQPAATQEVSKETPRESVDIPAAPLSGVLPEPDVFAVLFVNVGKADAAIIRNSGKTALVDTGSADSAPQLIAGLNALGVTRIDAVFVTHSHADHLGGLDSLAANYEIGVVYSPIFGATDKNGTGRIAKRADQLDLAYHTLTAGDAVQLGDISFAVLGPLVLNETDENDNSLVLRVSYGNNTFLFTGDMQFAEEQTLLDSGTDLKSDVLKIGNHGNPDATSDAFAALVSPAFAVVSTDTAVDEDSAHPRVLAAVSSTDVFLTQDFPIGVLMTIDESGDIAVANPADDSPLPPVAIESFDAKEQTITLVNHSSADVDLSGCVLFSARTGATLRFPAGSVIPAGDSLIIGQGGAYPFPNEKKPLKKNDNTVLLYSPFGSPIDE